MSSVAATPRSDDYEGEVFEEDADEGATLEGSASDGDGTADTEDDDSGEEESTGESSSGDDSADDGSEDSDEDSDDDSSDDSVPLDVKVQIFPHEETRGFTIRKRKHALRIIRSRIKKDYKVKAHSLSLLYSDPDGDVVTIRRSSDFAYAMNTHSQSVHAAARLKLRANLGDSLSATATATATATASASASASAIGLSTTHSALSAPPSQQQLRERAREQECEIVWVPGEVLGAGSFGTVYSGLNLSSGERIACKECLLGSRTGRNSIKTIEREVRILSQLTHDNIIRYLGTEVLPSAIRIFLEMANEGSLKDALREFGPLPEPVISRYIGDIVRGLGHLHKHRVIHRDIKPSNLLLSRGLVKIADFGCSALLAEVAGAADAVASASLRDEQHTVAGTTMYMAPEVMHHGHGDGVGVGMQGSELGGRTVTPRERERSKSAGEGGYGRKADIWSLGITMTEMATANPPYRSAASALYSVCVTKDYPSLPGCMSPQAHAFLARCLVESPASRASAKELATDAFLLEQLSVERVRADSARPGSRQTTSAVSFSPQIVNTKGGARSKSQSSLAAASRYGRDFDDDEFLDDSFSGLPGLSSKRERETAAAQSRQMGADADDEFKGSSSFGSSLFERLGVGVGVGVGEGVGEGAKQETEGWRRK